MNQQVIFLILVRVLGQLSPLSWLGEEDLMPLLIPSAMPRRGGEGRIIVTDFVLGSRELGVGQPWLPHPRRSPSCFKNILILTIFALKVTMT